MGTRQTRLIVSLTVLGMCIFGMILGAIMKDASIVITSLGTGSGTGITYIGGKSINNNTQIKNK